MAKRHADALFIQQGACNPSAITNSIVDAYKEIRVEPTYRGTDSLTSDPAVKLMVHQLAFICGITSGVEGMAKKPDYLECTNECEKRNWIDGTHEHALAFLTPEQRKAVYAKFENNSQGTTTIGQFVVKTNVRSDTLNGCAAMDWCGMYVGIEKDGTAHT